MSRFLASTITLLALTATSAVAADLPRQAMPYKAPAYVAPAFNWTGFYIGLNGGYGWGRSNWSTIATTTRPRGGLFGITAGYNWQAPGSPWVFGLEGDVDWSDMRASATTVGCPVGCTTRNDWLGTFRGRIGYSVDRFLPYVTGGLAVGNIKATPAGFAGVDDTNAGWTLGGGIEAMIAPNWTAKVEYLHVNLGNVSCSAVNCGGVPLNVSFHADIVRGGINFKF
jgi:outer membrane immunogenic protein